MFRTLAALSLIGCFFIVNPGMAATIYVPDHYATIQDAIDAASNGDTVIVRPGTYLENINFIGKDIVVQSEMGPLVTTIDGNQLKRVVRFRTNETSSSVLDGFHITNGTHADVGAGIYCDGASPTIINNIISGNATSGPWGGGGGIGCVNNSQALIEDNVISDNYTDYNGAGIHLGSFAAPTIRGNLFTRNLTGYGGAIAMRDSDPLIEDNLFTENDATSGGAIQFWSTSLGTIKGNVITRNESIHQGGGIACSEGSTPTLVNNIISWNTAGWDGGGIYADQSSYMTLTNNTFYGNTTALTGGGVFFGTNASGMITNTILWANVPSQIGTDWTAPPTVSYCDVEGGWSGGFLILDADPLFVQPDFNDYHLQLSSPCKDMGDSLAPALPLTDFEGDDRFYDGNPDMGADEFHRHLYHVGDVTPGSPIAVRVVGEVGEPVGLYLGSGIQDPPMTTMYGDLYLLLPPVLQLSLGFIPAEGVLSTIGTVPSFWNPGEEHPLQALVGPIGVPTSRLTNLMVLEVQ